VFPNTNTGALLSTVELAAPLFAVFIVPDTALPPLAFALAFWLVG
jgi:hypothetical protein